MKSIRTNQLTPGNTYLVGGNIAFSRLARQTTDEERARDNQRRKQASPNAISVERNYTTATIYNAQVYCTDPNNPTLEERYANECLYVSKSKKNYSGSCFSGMNKGDFLPRVYVKNSAGQYDEITLEHELANDLHVILVMKVFPGMNGNNGVSLESVLVDDPQGLKYYEPNSEVNQTLAARGIILNTNGTGARRASEGIPANEGTATDDVPMADDIDSAAAPNAFSATPQQAPISTGNAFSSMPTGQTPPPQPPQGNFTPGNFGPGNRTY